MVSLISEVTKILNNEETPWVERLKVADNAFVSLTLPIRQKEIFLLKWIISSPDFIDNYALQQCLKWITSSQIMDLCRSDLSAEDLIEITSSLANYIHSDKRDDNKTTELLHRIAAAFIENKIFQHHFKFNMKLYYSFVSSYITNIHLENVVETSLLNDQLLPRSLPLDYKLLIEDIFWSFVQVAAKYPNSEAIFKAISGIICRCVFKPNIEKFTTTLNALFSNSKKAEVDLFAILFCTNDETSHTYRQMYYKLLLDAFYNSTKNFSIIYKFIIILFKNLGMQFGNMFNCKPVLSVNYKSDEGIVILLQMFEIISRNKNDFDCKIDDISFNDFIKHFAQVRLKQPPCKETLQLAHLIFKMNASLIHELTDHLIIYLLLNNFDNMQDEYNNLFRFLIETYFKLNRIPGLIHKLLAAPVDGPSNIAVRIVQDDSFHFQNEIHSENIVTFSYNIKSTLSPKILESLSNYLVQLVSNQCVNIFMTLLHKWDLAIKDLESTFEDPKKIFILEIISTVLCQVLSSVKFADNTISDVIIIKFVNIMEKIRDGLQIFGSSLVGYKHEPRLMRAFLNASYTWAELYIISEYYSINKKIICKKDNDFSDSSPYNISYLHNYLTSEQWCLISERITNFGETPCKQLMFKLCLQKLKAMSMFEGEINKDVFNSVQHYTVSSMRLVWNLFLMDQFAIDVLLPTLEYQDKEVLANCLMLDIVKNKEKRLFSEWKIFNDIQFNKAILINILYEISTLLRTKRKREDTGRKCNSTKLLKELLRDEALAEDCIIDIFIECIGKEDSVPNSYNENQLMTYLILLKTTPLSTFSENVQITFFLYLCALLQDVKTVTSGNAIVTELESLILGTLQITSLPIIAKMPIIALISYFEQNFVRYVEIFQQIFNIFIKNEKCAMDLSNGITLMIKSAKVNKKYIDLCLVATEMLFRGINSKKISSDHKALLEGYNNDIISKLIKLIVDKTIYSVEAYAFILNNSMNKNNSENLETSLPLLDTYFNHSIANVNDGLQITGILTLFITIIKSKTSLPVSYTNSILSIWNACKNIAITEKDEALYSKLNIAIFENISNEQFQNLLEDILLSITKAIDNDDEHIINKELKRCTSILPCMFNGTKKAIWSKALEQYLFKLTQYFCGRISNNALVQFLLNIQASTKMYLTSVILDLNFVAVHNILHNVKNIENFLVAFPDCYSIMDSLLKHRKLIILENLPAYLQQYRHLLGLLCKYSDITKPENIAYMDEFIEYAHSLEKLTTYMVSTGKYMSRISQYLITEFLNHYETITIHASVKIHLNNCIFQLISLCDNHALSYLMRTLNTAPTEMFKLLYETYKKYYKFTGKV